MSKCVCGKPKSRNAKHCWECFSILRGTWGEKRKDEYLSSLRKCKCGTEIAKGMRMCASCKGVVCKCGAKKSCYADECKKCRLKTIRASVRSCSGCGATLYAHIKSNMCGTCAKGAFIPVARIQPLVKRLIEERDYTVEQGQGLGGVQVLAHEVGLAVRQIYAIQNGEFTNVRASMLDRILMPTGNWKLWYLPPEEGGFRDYYCDDPAPPATEKPECKVRLRKVKPKQYCACGNEIRAKHGARQCIICYRSKPNAAKKRLNRQMEARFALSRATK